MFHSEADFQQAFAWEVRTQDPTVRVRLETRPAPGIRLDLLLISEDEQRRTAVELKYLTRFWTGEFAGERFELKDQGAQDIRAHDVVKDIVRVEKFVAAMPGSNGAVVCVGNDPSYWNAPTHGRPTNADAFRLHESTVLHGPRAWGPLTGAGTSRGREAARVDAQQLLVDVAVLLGRVGSAVSAVEGVIDVAGTTVSAADRAVAGAEVVSVGAQVLLGQVDAVVGRAAGTADKAGSVVAVADALADRVRSVVTVAEEVAGAAVEAVEQAAAMTQRLGPVVEFAVEVGEQASAPAEVLLPVLRAHAPSVAALVPDVVAALRDLLEQLPELLRRLDQDVLPTLQQLRNTPGDVRASRETVSQIEPLVREVEAELAGLPGSTLLRRRGRRPEPDPVPVAATPVPSSPDHDSAAKDSARAHADAITGPPAVGAPPPVGPASS